MLASHARLGFARLPAALATYAVQVFWEDGDPDPAHNGWGACATLVSVALRGVTLDRARAVRRWGEPVVRAHEDAAGQDFIDQGLTEGVAEAAAERRADHERNAA